MRMWSIIIASILFVYPSIYTVLHDDYSYIYTSTYSNPTPRNESIDQQQNSSCGYGLPLMENMFYAQSFILLIGKVGNPVDSEITVSIRKHLHKPITMVSVDGSKISENGSWVEADVYFINIDAGYTYYITCGVEGGDLDNHYVWFFQVDNPYVDGSVFVSEDGGYTWDPYESYEYDDPDLCFITYGLNNTPPTTPIKPDGPTEGFYGEAYTYSTHSIDVDGDEIYYKWSWGDGTNTSWLGPYKSGETCEATHTWLIKGSYIVKVKARDQWNIETSWSDPLIVKMGKKKSFPQYLIGRFFIQLESVLLNT